MPVRWAAAWPRRRAWASAVERAWGWRRRTRAVGLINAGKDAMTIVADFKELKLDGKQVVRDLWRQKDIGTFDGNYDATVPSHGVVFVKLTPAK